MAQDPNSVIIDHNTVFPASRPGVKTALIFIGVVFAVVIGIYLPAIKATFGF